MASGFEKGSAAAEQLSALADGEIDGAAAAAACGAWKTDVSNQSCPGPTAPSTAGVPLTFGRCVLPGAFSVALLIVIAIGDPDW